MSEVQLYIYDLSFGLARPLASPLLGLRLDGVWHTSIVVHSTEIYFSDSGIKTCVPGSENHGILKEKKILGYTRIQMDELTLYLRQLGQNE